VGDEPKMLDELIRDLGSDWADWYFGAAGTPQCDCGHESCRYTIVEQL
jgi:hypothetical protein